MTRKPRPCWVVLAPVRAGIENKVRRAYDGDEDKFAWEIRKGTAGYIAIIEYRPGYQGGGDEPLAKSLSRGATKPTYLMWFDDDAPRVMAFAKGTYVGNVSAWPDDVARQLGCTFPQRLTGRGQVDLTPRKIPEAQRGERKLVGYTTAQWKHLIQYEENWSALPDAATERDALAVLRATSHKDPSTRAIACRLAEVISIYGFGAYAPAAVERLRALESTDSVEEVRLAARAAASALSCALEQHRIQVEFPWISNFDEQALPKALATLDDEREAVRLHTYTWWVLAWQVPMGIGARVKRKLEDLRKRERSKELKSAASQALKNVREKMRKSARTRR